MTSPDDSVTTWPQKLESTIRSLHHLNAVTVLEETASTQDAAVRLGCEPGHVVTAGVQTEGRGRLGRSWIDRAGDGIAVTLVLERDLSPRLSVVAAVSAVQCVQRFLPGGVRAQIRWPNDILVAGSKIAGILIEQDERAARLGIGINVAQETFDPSIEQAVTSLRLLGVRVDRCSVLEALLEAIDRNLGVPEAELGAAFAEADALRGTTCRFRVDGAEVCGVVQSIDPFGRLLVAGLDSEGVLMELDPRTTSLVHASDVGVGSSGDGTSLE